MTDATDKKHVISIIFQTSTTKEDGSRKIDSETITDEGANEPAEYLVKRRVIRAALEEAKAGVVNAMESLEEEGIKSGADINNIDWLAIGKMFDDAGKNKR